MSRLSGSNSYTDVSSIAQKIKQASIYNLVLDASCVEECSWKGDMEDLEVHQETCEFVDTKCDLCGQDVKRKDMDKHLTQQCPEQEAPQCGKFFKRKEFDIHVDKCEQQKLSAEQLSAVTDLRTKQDNQHQNTDQLKLLVQAQQTTVTDTIVDFLQESQQQWQQTLIQLQEKFLSQQVICNRNHQEQEQRDRDMKQSIARLEADLRKQQKDQQAAVKDWQSAHSRLEGALKAQDGRIKQDIARFEKQQKHISDQQQKLESKVSAQQETVAQLNTQLQGQQKSCDSSNADFQKQMAEQRDDSMKQSMTRLEVDLKKLEKDQQAAIKDQQSALSRLEVALKALVDRTQQDIAKIEKRLKQISDNSVKQQPDKEMLQREMLLKDKSAWCCIN